MALALFFATLASTAVYQTLHSHSQGHALAKAESTIPVVVAKRDLAVGKRLTREDLTVQSWPKEITSERYFRSPKDLLGRMLRSSVVSEEPFTPSKLLEEGENFSSLIPSHMRGVTLVVRRSDALVKLLERGSLVDVIGLFENSGGVTTTKVIAQAARVLAVHEKIDPLRADQTSKQMEVTLMVKPQDAERLVLAMNKGIVEIVIRNQHEPVGSVSTAAS